MSLKALKQVFGATPEKKRSPRNLQEKLENSRDSSLESLEALQKDQAGFLKLADLLQAWVGIHLPVSAKNVSLMSGRLNRILMDRGIENYSEYADLLITQKGELASEFISAMTTNTTQFFREDAHFETLKKCLPEILKNNSKSREIRVWCAASSTGQEPYTLAIVLSEALKDFPLWKIKILATDIDQEVLDRASQGIYTPEECTSLPPLYRQKYFSVDHGAKESRYRVKDSLRSLVVFKRFNLLGSAYAFSTPFDIIFCRNVLIYFDKKDCEYVVSNLVQSVAQEGFVFVGHAESGALRHPDIASISSAVAQKVRSTGSASSIRGGGR